jgi:hypothetical protein
MRLAEQSQRRAPRADQPGHGFRQRHGAHGRTDSTKPILEGGAKAGIPDDGKEFTVSARLTGRQRAFTNGFDGQVRPTELPGPELSAGR